MATKKAAKPVKKGAKLSGKVKAQKSVSMKGAAQPYLKYNLKDVYITG
jgi:hypothetical protein